MIHLQTLFSNGFWLLGASIILANLSYASWKAHSDNLGLRQILAKHQMLRWIWLGLALIGAGLATTGNTLIESVIWIALTLMSLVFLVINRRRHHTPEC